MQRVPWMCWKRMSDNWKAYILAYAWPVPISSRILWSLSLLNRFKLNGDFFFFFFFFPSCQLESCEILSILVFVLLGNGQVLERSQEQALADIPCSFWVQPSHLNPATAWHERGLGGLCHREKEECLTKTKCRVPFTLTPDLCSVGEHLPVALRKRSS